MRAAREPEQRVGPFGPRFRQRLAGQLVAPIAGAARHGAVRRRRQRERLAREREAVPLRLVAAHAHGRALELRLPGDRVDSRRDQRPDARIAREHAAPMHRHERLPRRHGVRDLEAHDDARRGRRDLGEIAEREAEARRIERMQLHERLCVVARQARATCRCASSCATDRGRGPCSARADSRARLLRRGARRRRHELRLAARRVETGRRRTAAASLRRRVGRGHWNGSQAFILGVAHVRDAADVEVASAFVLERREARVLAEDLGRRVVSERRAEAHAPRDFA